MINKGSIVTFFNAFATVDLKKIFGVLIGEIFQNALLFYLFLNLLEYYQPGSITRYFSLKLLLLLLLASGTFVIAFPKDLNQDPKQKFKTKHFVYLFLLLVVFNLLIYNKLKALGSLVWIILTISLIFSLSAAFYLICENSKGNQDDQFFV